jgi:hypothetical protein
MAAFVGLQPSPSASARHVGAPWDEDEGGGKSKIMIMIKIKIGKEGLVIHYQAVFGGAVMPGY